jgi:hypothetical protein
MRAVIAAVSAATLGVGLLTTTAQASSRHARATNTVAVHLKIYERGRSLVVELTGPGNREVRVVYTASYHGEQLATGERVVALVNGKRTTTFQLSKHVAEEASVAVKASFVKG